MKSCGSNSGTAHSRDMQALAGAAQKTAFANWRGGLIGRWLSHHRFALILCVSLCFAVASRAYSALTPSAHAETHAALASPQQAASSQSLPSGSKTPEQTSTEQYTLSHERQAKAVAYSRAGDRKSTRLNSSHSQISYAVFC